MPNERDEALRVIRDLHRDVLGLEDEAAAGMKEAFSQARETILERLTSWWERNGAGVAPAQRRALARDVSILRQIDEVMEALGGRMEATVRTSVEASRDLALEAAQREVRLYAQGLGVTPARIPLGTVEVVESIVDQVPGIVQQTKSALTAELRRGLIAGESFPDLVKGLLQLRLTDRASVFRRGRTSAELFARRSVIQAENASRDVFYEQASDVVPGLQKQMVAVVTSRTTDTCLIAHGQIQDLGDPYKLSGTPRFSDEIMYPPFHWNCRSASVSYHPDFEEGASVTTDAMKEAASRQLADRKAA